MLNRHNIDNLDIKSYFYKEGNWKKVFGFDETKESLSYLIKSRVLTSGVKKGLGRKGKAKFLKRIIQ